MKVNWTPAAKDSFERILDWLLNNWTKKEVENFIEQTEKTIEGISQNPYMYKASSKNKQIRKGFVNRLISLFYRVRHKENEIDILYFWDNRQNPNER